ncbi:hypothetical protein BDR22DRAFT_894127 [Usnea florida]
MSIHFLLSLNRWVARWQPQIVVSRVEIGLLAFVFGNAEGMQQAILASWPQGQWIGGIIHSWIAVDGGGGDGDGGGDGGGETIPWSSKDLDQMPRPQQANKNEITDGISPSCMFVVDQLRVFQSISSKYSDAITLQQVGSPKTLDHPPLLVARGSCVLGKLSASTSAGLSREIKNS